VRSFYSCPFDLSVLYPPQTAFLSINMQLSSSPLAFRPRFLVQLAVVSVVLITLWLTFDSSSPLSTTPPRSPFTSSSSSHSNPIVLEARPGKSKKVESDTASPPWRFTRPKEELKPCEKIFLFSFVPWWGFASEFILYVSSLLLYMIR